MALHPLAGQPVPEDLWIDVAALERHYFENTPDAADPVQAVSFGTSGHRGTPTNATFTEAHILAITQAICDYRKREAIDGPLFLGIDTHAISGPAQRTALEVLAANGVDTVVAAGGQPTPTPVISWAILDHNRHDRGGTADGVVITPSHNPPADGGFKYNPPTGGPAGTEITTWMQDRANELLRDGNRGVKRADAAAREHDYVTPYVADLKSVVDLDAIRGAGVRIGADPLGGASLPYWGPIGETYGLDLTVVNRELDPTFKFMRVDHDGKIRMDCSSPHAMAGLVDLKDRFDVAFGNDPDADRHGVVTPSAGLLNPNHYLAVAIQYLLAHRPNWPASASIGKTLVSSAMIDRVVRAAGRRLSEVPVGFKWFAPGLFDGSCAFGGEESAGASFLRTDGTVWTTDKDGIILDLLAAEVTAKTGKDPGQHFEDLAAEHGLPYYTRIDAAASPEEKAKLEALTPDAVEAAELAGQPIVQKLTRAPGNDAAIGGLKVVTAGGWFAARPSGTENIYKIYAESFDGESHLQRIVEEAQAIVSATLAS